MPASGPAALPPVYTPVAGQSLDAAGHIDDLHENDRLELRALWTKLGLGSSSPARGKSPVGDGTGSIWDATARKNRLVNGNFLVSQRATLGTTDNSYILDRWRLLLEAASAAAAAQEASDLPTDGSKRGCRLTVGSGEDNKFGIFQVLEFADCADLRGKSVSVQAKLKATAGITDVRMAVLEFTGTADSVSGDPISAWNAAATNPTLAANWAYLGTPANLSPTTSWATYRVEGLTVGASANNLAVLIWCDDETTTVTTDILRITDVQLEEGAVCTNVERRRYAEELYDCQWWLVVIGFNSTTARAGVGLCSANNAGEAIFPLPREMRTVPAATYAAAAKYQVYNGGSLTVLNSISTNSPTRTMHSILWGVATTPYAAAQAVMVLGVDSASIITLSAEL